MSRNIRTLGDFRNAGTNSSGEESEGDEQQGFFVGGSEHSGQQVLGPRSDVREDVFQAARRAGAEELREEPEQSARQGPSSFVGTAARLGRTNDDHEIIGGSAAGGAAEEAQDGSDLVVRLNMWENGFSLDDGPLRDLQAPENTAFLRDIMRGVIPQELSAAHPRHAIDLRMEKKGGPYEAPKPKPFDGTGARLGGFVPNVVSNSAPAAAPASSKKDSEEALSKAQAEVQLDAGSATTQVQIRLADGNRLVAKFNHAHTVNAIRNFIVTARPELAFSEFQIMTTYPNKIVEDETLSLADAGLLNSVVVVKPVA